MTTSAWNLWYEITTYWPFMSCGELLGIFNDRSVRLPDGENGYNISPFKNQPYYGFAAPICQQELWRWLDSPNSDFISSLMFDAQVLR